jgi:endonuclease YncB( thermonuclease family)
MTNKIKKKLTVKELVKKGVPYPLILGFIAAGILGWGAKALIDAKSYHELGQLFPSSGVVLQIEDGDTFTLNDGVRVRMIGIDTPDMGGKKYTEAKDELSKEVLNKKVYLEYDRYQDDKYGRVLAWVWIDCETTPQFLPADYMHKSGNESNPGLTQNPKGCKKGKLVNEELIKQKLAIPVVYKDRGELKYQKRINFGI